MRSVPTLSQTLDAAVIAVKVRRRGKVQRVLENNITLRVSLRTTRWMWRHRGVPGRGISLVLGGLSHAYDRAAAAKAAKRVRSEQGTRATYLRCPLCGNMIINRKMANHMAWHQSQRKQSLTAVVIVRDSHRPGQTPPPSTKRSTAMAMLGTRETALLLKAVRGIAHMEPHTAWDVIAQLNGLSRAIAELSRAIGDYGDAVESEKVDPRVVLPINESMDVTAASAMLLARAGLVFRTLYAAHMDAAESGVKQPKRPGFFDPNNANS